MQEWETYPKFQCLLVNFLSVCHKQPKFIAKITLYVVTARFLSILPQMSQIHCKSTFVEGECKISSNSATNVPNSLQKYLSRGGVQDFSQFCHKRSQTYCNVCPLAVIVTSRSQPAEGQPRIIKSCKYGAFKCKFFGGQVFLSSI